MSRRLKNNVLMLLTEKERREGRRIKQAEIARSIGVANHTIGSWIRNDVTKLEAHIVVGLCEYFECGLTDLLYIEDVNGEVG